MNIKITIEGLVQGIGYRPFVAKKAEELNITGWVRNTSGIVTVVAQQEEAVLRQFVSMLKNDTPPGGYVLEAKVEEIACEKFDSFVIEESDINSELGAPVIPIDLPTCPDCERELLDPSNRRYRHPFISCVNCGPRYTIIEDLPYDRDRIVLKKFELCPECHSEYTAKADRRRHAQTVSCKTCGPQAFLVNYIDGKEVATYDLTPAVDKAIEALMAGKIVAIKDLGGFHLACLPTDEQVVSLLRVLKKRQTKPFAVTFFDMKSVEDYCYVSKDEARLLESPAHPIVLLKKKLPFECAGPAFSNNLCVNSSSIGAMLCNNPIQILLTKACGPLVMTSGNSTGDLLFTDEKGMGEMLLEASKEEPLKDKLCMLYHNRDILVPMDDSITRVVAGRTIMSRRARGYAPNPIPVDLEDGIFASGGDLKSTFLYTRDKKAYISTQFGDLADEKCIDVYRAERARMGKLFGLTANCVVSDKHPGYVSTAEAQTFASDNNINVHSVQHHKAHVASVICEHGITGKVLGVAFDGTGFGDDGSMWGSEFFLFEDDKEVQRVGSLFPFSLPRGDEAAKRCELPLLALMVAADELSQDEQLNAKADITKKAVQLNLNRIKSTSMGRFFDGISCALGFATDNGYEGEAACNLEYGATRFKDAYAADTKIVDQDNLHIDIVEKDNFLYGNYKRLLRRILDSADASSEDRQRLALDFHEALSDYILDMALIMRDKEGVNQVALSGGTFFNQLLTTGAIIKLENAGFKVYINEKVPCGDGGLCLGQAYMAANTKSRIGQT